MALAEHLRELRKRFLLAAVGVALGMIVGWVFYDRIFELLLQPLEPLRQMRPELTELNFSRVGSAFDMQVRISFFVGLIVTSPWWIYQFWAFITPGLTKKERRSTFGVVAAAVPLFLAGVALAWTVLPNAFRILLGEFTPEGTVNILTAADYLKFVIQIVLAFGIAFLMPLFMVVLNFLNLVKGGTWLRGWRWAIVGIFTFCAFATPTPDPTPMIMLAMPIVALYFIAVLICHIHDKRVAKRRAAEDAELAAATD